MTGHFKRVNKFSVSNLSNFSVEQRKPSNFVLNWFVTLFYVMYFQKKIEEDRIGKIMISI